MKPRDSYNDELFASLLVQETKTDPDTVEVLDGENFNEEKNIILSNVVINTKTRNDHNLTSGATTGVQDEIPNKTNPQTYEQQTTDIINTSELDNQRTLPLETIINELTVGHATINDNVLSGDDDEVKVKAIVAKEETPGERFNGNNPNESVTKKPKTTTKIILTTPDNNQIDLMNTETKNDENSSYRNKYMKFNPNLKTSGNKAPSEYEAKRKARSTNKKHTKNKRSYDNPNFIDFKTSTREYYQFLNRYRVADTLSIFSRQKLQTQLRKHGIYYVNIGLFGQLGSGKSSLLNSMYYAINGNYVEFSAESKINVNEKNSVTNERVELRLTEAITVLDNRGLDFSNQCLNEIEKQCDGYREPGGVIPDHWNISFSQKLEDIITRCKTKSLLRNKIQCAVVVSSMKQKFEHKHLGELVRRLKLKTYRNPVVIITNSENFEHSKIQERIRQFQEINCARVYHVENYTYANHEARKPETDEQIVEALFNCCIVADQSTNETLKRLENPGSCC